MSSGAVSIAARAEPVEAQQAAGFYKRLLRRPLAIVCIAFLLFVTGLAIFAPILMPEVVHENLGDLLSIRQPPSRRNLLGTDTFGRDVLNRLLVGSRLEMVGVAEVVVVSSVLGIPLGLAAGYLAAASTSSSRGSRTSRSRFPA